MIPKWKKIAPGEYHLSTGEFVIIKGKPDWADKTDGYPTTEWHLFDRLNQKISSAYTYYDLAKPVIRKYMEGILGDPQPINLYRFSYLAPLHWTHTGSTYWSEEEKLREIESKLEDYYHYYAIARITHLAGAHIKDESGGDYIRHEFEYKTTEPIWQEFIKNMKKLNKEKSLYGGYNYEWSKKALETDLEDPNKTAERPFHWQSHHDLWL